MSIRRPLRRGAGVTGIQQHFDSSGHSEQQ
jgi:hypothetical protein